MPAQSTIFPIFLRAEYSDSTAIHRFQSDAQRAAQAAKREFQGVGAALEQALSRSRNTSGSLDLGLDELRLAAAQQQQVARASRELAEATKRAATANGQFNASMSGATRAAFQLANAEDRATRELLEQVNALEAVQRELNQTASATDLVTQAARRGTTARGSVINSARAERTAFVQLGQQLQDVGVQFQSGTSAITIFTQQLPQAAFALTGLAGSTNKTKAAIGAFATFLSGPFGGALVIATALLGPFIAELFKSGDAADESARAQRSLSEVLSDTTSSYEEVTKALESYIQTQQRSREVTILTIQDSAEAIAQNLREAISIREKTKARIADLQAADANLRATGDRGAFGFGVAADNLVPLIAEQDAQIKLLMRGAADVRVQAATEIARINSDSGARIKAGFDVLREQANRTVKDVGALTSRLTQLNRDEAAALEAERKAGRTPRRDRSAEIAARKAARETEQLANFGEKAAEQIQRINERFDEQPRLIDQASAATRQLDGLIRELSERKPVDFQTMIDDAQEAKRVIEDAIQRPIEDILRQSQEQLQIEGLIAQGRIDQAAALQVIFQLEQQIGDLTEQQKDDIRDQIVFEQQKTRELRVQSELLELQGDVVRTFSDDLRSLLSGRKVDILGNFKQALADLQGARLFEDLFGPAFRELEEELRGNTPQGKANAAFTAEVNKVAATTSTAETQIGNLGDAAGMAATAINDAIMELRYGYNPGAGIVANDNESIASDITVNGTRPDDIEIATKSTKDIADRIAKATVDGFLGPLEDLLGPKFTAQLGGVLSGALAGFARGGTPGAVLGGLGGLSDQLFGKDSPLSGILGKAGAGAATGTGIAGLSKALGLGGSTTGAQIGGAAGSFLPFPGGDIVGAIAGNFIGSLLKGTKRGSATIGGVGGSLGITGTRGNSGSLKDTANTLAGSVLEAVNNIARELGANVDSGRGGVSIGQRDKNLRVDTSGRGITKTRNGAVDFGDDAEAAIAFAVQDLIKDGVITGLRAAENRLLQAGGDIEAAIRDVLDFRAVFDRLREIKDPVGFAVDQLNKEFEDLIELFTRAGAGTEEFASLEELYNLERAEAIKNATDRVSDALRSLLQDLTIGDSGLSLRSRRANAVSEFDGLATRVAAGDSSAFDDFADISQQLLDIERELFGSTQSYFDRLAQITALTEQAIAGQTGAAGNGSGAAPSPFDERNAIARSIDAGTAEQVGWLRAINDNLIAAMNPNLRSEQVRGGGGGNFVDFPSFFPRLTANF